MKRRNAFNPPTTMPDREVVVWISTARVGDEMPFTWEDAAEAFGRLGVDAQPRTGEPAHLWVHRAEKAAREWLARDPGDMVGPGLVEGLAALQRAENERLRAMTPEERAADAREALRRMPGQAYLFDDGEEA